VNGVLARYDMDVPTVMKIPTAGGQPTKILDGLYNPSGQRLWMNWIREPVVSPDGSTLAIATDLPNPTVGDVVLKLYDLQSRRLRNPLVPEVSPLGHQDPAWRPDGKVLAYVYNNRDGATGVPQIYGLTIASNKARTISGPGYLHPSWSPDGRYLAATKTSAYGTDVVVLNASTGAELLKVTNDGSSWGPAWSPAGDQIAFLHVEGQVVDLRLVQLKGDAGTWTVGDTIDLTQNAGLDSVSRPDWFVPIDQLPIPTQAPASSAGPSDAPPSPSPSGS
jgi:dipeptidyl aminopeptidase/acylaminoacyl peptidase